MSLRPPVYLSNWIFLSEAGSRIVPTVIRVLYVVFMVVFMGGSRYWILSVVQPIY